MAIIDWLRPMSALPALPGPVVVDERAGWWPSIRRALGIDSAIQSTQTGLGIVGTDPGATWQVRPRPILSYGILDTLYRQNALARRVVGVLPDAAMASPWRLDDANRRDVAAEFDEAVGLRSVVGEWWTRARLNGACLAVPYFEGQGPDLSKPMPAGPRPPCTAVQTFAGEEVSVLAYDLDPGSPRFGQPMLYSVTALVPGASVSSIIHASRGVWLGSGMYLPPIMRQVYPNSTDLPVLEAYWTAIGHRWQLDSAAASLAPKMVEGVLSIPGLAGISGAAPDVTAGAATPNGFANTIAQEFARSASVVGVGVIDGAMSYQRHAAALTGFADVDATSRREASYVEGFPQRVIFGDEPGGLGNGGEGAMRQWTVIVESARQTLAGPAIMQLYRLIFGPEIPKARLVWEPMERPSVVETAQIRAAHATADAAYVNAGILTPEEVRQRWTGPEYAEELTLDADAGEFATALTGASLDADDYAIPDAVQGNARKALDWREKHGDAVQGGTSTGWARARQLAAGGRVSADDVVTIAAWWARHRDNAREPDAEYADEPWRDAGYVSGLLWGGKSGDAWATEARKAIE